MRIGELARETEVRVDTLRFYERRGLLPRPARTRGGYRDYGSAALERVRWIRSAQAVGFTLGEIGALLAAPATRRGECGALRSAGARKLAELDAALRALERRRSELADVLASCRGRGERARCDALPAALRSAR